MLLNICHNLSYACRTLNFLFRISRCRLMIYRKSKRAISWLLIVAMLQLVLSTSGSVVMASPQMESEPMSIQLMQQACFDCEHHSQHVLFQAVSDCDDYEEKICLSSCSVYVQVSLFARMYTPLSMSGSEDFFHRISPTLTSLGYKPIPRPPKQHHS